MTKLLMRVVLGLALLGGSLGVQAGSLWTSSIDEATGLPMLEVGGARAIRPSMPFWGANWGWAGMYLRFKMTGPGAFESTGRSEPLKLDLLSRISRNGESGWVFDMQLKAAADMAPIVGGGLDFQFDQGLTGGQMGEVALLPGNQGWRWGRDGGPQVEMRFEPALPAVFFNAGNKNHVRAFFYQDKLSAGEQRYKVTWTVKGPVDVLPPTVERLGGKPVDDWPLDSIGTRSAPVDLSFLNQDHKPAGKHGVLKADKDALVFADGTPARFWGTNITAYALFNTPRDTVREQARRLSALGYNLVRLHHHDSPWVGYNVFGNYAAISNTQTLDEGALEKLDWWIKCLKEEGLYVWLDLHVQRHFKAGDNIPGFDEMRKGQPQADLKGFNYVSPEIRQAMKRFNEAYLNHKNAFTGIANKDEPAVVALLVTNENDLTSHYGNGLLPDKNVPLHNKLYMAEADAFAKTWGLNKDKVWRSWEQGPSRLFLNDLERRFDEDMEAHLRGLGSKALVVPTSSWGYNPLGSLPALTSGDLIDVHAYSPQGALEKHPVYGANFMHWLGAAQVLGYPLSVTEWNAEPFPLPDRHVLPLYLAATASHQGWDALMHYAYTQEPTERNVPSNWHGYNDPSLIAMMPAAALLYRERHAAEATTTYVFDPGAEVFYNQYISAGNAPALRTAMERGKLLIAMPATRELPWLERKPLPAGAIVLREPGRPVLPPTATEAVTDTGQLTRNWAEGTYTINTPRTRAALGWIGGRTVNLPDVEMRLVTRHISVAVQSLEDKPVGESAQLLVSIATRSQPQVANKAPLLVEPPEGTLSIRAPKGLKLYAIVKGSRQEWPASYADGRYSFKLDGKTALNWLILR